MDKLKYTVRVKYPAALSLFVSSYIKVFNTRREAADAFKAATGKELPPYDPVRAYQPWMDTRPKPPGKFAASAGYQYNIVGKGRDGFFRVEINGVPWCEASVPNISPDLGVSADFANEFPIRRLAMIAETGGFEVVATSIFGCQVVDTSHLNETGQLMVPDDILAQVNNGTYVPPGV